MKGSEEEDEDDELGLVGGVLAEEGDAERKVMPMMVCRFCEVRIFGFWEVEMMGYVEVVFGLL